MVKEEDKSHHMSCSMLTRREMCPHLLADKGTKKQELLHPATEYLIKRFKKKQEENSAGNKWTAENDGWNIFNS